MRASVKTLILIILFVSLTGTSRYLYPQWVPQYSGVTGDLYSISGAGENNIFAFGAGNVFLKTTNSGNNWAQINTGLSVAGLRLCYFVNSLSGWIGGRAIYKTTNGGVNWFLQRTYDSTYGYNCFCFVNSSTGWCTYSRNVWPPEGGVLYTSNGGTNWIVQRSSLDYYQCVHFINGSTGFISGYAYFYKTTNAGLNWTYSSYSNGVRVYFVSPDTGWVSSFSIYKTTNGGANWVYQLGSSSQFSALVFSNSLTGYAAAGNKIYKTSNAGAVWTENLNLPSGNLWDLYMFDAATGWAAGTGGIIYKTTNGGITAVNSGISGKIPDTYLFQNVPNPFNPSTKISFRILSGTQVSLDVYDTEGRLAANLISEYLNAGSYTTTFDASRMTAGVYLYRLKTNGYSLTRKMVLLK